MSDSAGKGASVSVTLTQCAAVSAQLGPIWGWLFMGLFNRKLKTHQRKAADTGPRVLAIDEDEADPGKLIGLRKIKLFYNGSPHLSWFTIHNSVFFPFSTLTSLITVEA